LSCSTGSLIYGNNTCGTCPTSQYNVSSIICGLCSSNCLTCSNSATNCLTCGIINSSQSYLYSDSKCYNACPLGSYAFDNSSSYICSYCPAGCAQCSLVFSSV
jgi:proprotein convertase subtilisin/kexin type 5